MNLRERFYLTLHRVSLMEEWALPAGPPLPATPDEVIEQSLIHIGKALKVIQERSERPERARCNLLLALDQFMEERQGEAGARLTLGHVAQLKLVEFLFRWLEQAGDLHSQFFYALQYLQLSFARALLADPSILFDPGHPLVTLFETLVRVGRGYDETSGPRARELLHEIEGLVFHAVGSDLPLRDAYAACEVQTDRLLAGFDAQFQRLAQRLIEREQGQSQVVHARQLVVATIAQALEGKRLPEPVIDFLDQVWGKYLYVTFLREGLEGEAWRQAIADMREMVWSVTTHQTDRLKQAFSGSLAATLERMRHDSESIHHAFSTEAFFSTLAELHMATIRGRTPPKAIAWRIYHGAGTEIDAKGPPSEVLALRPGEWFHIRQRGIPMRSRLIARHDGFRYLLFSNYSGMLKARLDFAQFVQDRAAGDITPIAADPALGSALAFALDRLDEYLGELADRLAGEERQRAEEQATALRHLIEEEKRRKGEVEAQAERERQEGERLAQERALRRAVEEVEQIEVGGLLELIDDEGQSVTCSLGLRLKTTRKLVLVDRVGRKVAEFLPEQLAERIMDGRATVIQHRDIDRRLADFKWG